MARKGTIGDSPKPVHAGEDSFEKVKQQLEAGHPAKALEEITRSGERSARMTNATAVCQMRMGQGEKAVEILRNMTIQGAFQFRDDVPGLYKVNFAAALLSTGNVAGFLTALNTIRDGEPYIEKYRAAYNEWRASRSLGERLASLIRGSDARPFLPGFPLGDLE